MGIRGLRRCSWLQVCVGARVAGLGVGAEGLVLAWGGVGVGVGVGVGAGVG